jgi:hypothetical protein
MTKKMAKYDIAFMGITGEEVGGIKAVIYEDKFKEYMKSHFPLMSDADYYVRRKEILKVI